MFKNLDPSSCEYLSKWTNLTEDSSKYQWPLYWLLNSPNLISFNRIAKKNFQNPVECLFWLIFWDFLKSASLKNKILKLTEANKQLKKAKWFPKPQVLLSWLHCLSIHLKCNHFPSFYTTHAYTLPHINYLTKLLHFYKALFTPFSCELVKTCPFKIKFFEYPAANPSFLIFSGLKLNCEP